MLRRITQEDNYIQFLLELDICGYTEPDNPRSDLSYSGKREVLRSHKARLDHPEKIVPETYELHAAEDGTSSVYTGGVYVWALLQPTAWRGAIRQLYFYQFPSPNRGVKYKHWVVSDLGVEAEYYTIDPEQDLLVLLEGDSIDLPFTGYNLHLRSMSTNQAHPKACSASTIMSYRCSTSLNPASFVSFEISGCLLAVAFRSGSEEDPSCIVIWNWTTGVELTVSQKL